MLLPLVLPGSLVRLNCRIIKSTLTVSVAVLLSTVVFTGSAATSAVIRGAFLVSDGTWTYSIDHIRTTPSVEPVITTFCWSHSCVVEKATHRICCIRSALPTLVFTVANASPLADQMCSQVAEQVAISPVKSLMLTAATRPTWSRNWRTNINRDRSHTIADPSLEPDTMTL